MSVWSNLRDRASAALLDVAERVLLGAEPRASGQRDTFAEKSPRPSDLLREQARPTVGSVLSAHRQSVADTLTPAKMGALLRDADRGNMTAYLTLAEEMEERDPHYASVLGTRKLGVSGTAPSVVSASDDAHNTAIADHVEDAIVNAPVFEGLVLDLMDGVAKGFSNVEIIWDRQANEWRPERYEFRPQRHFVFDLDTLSTPLLRSITTPLGEPLQPFKWLVHKPKIRSGIPIRVGLARTVAISYAAKRYTVADWLAFMDVFGMPIRIGRYPSNMSDRKGELLRAIRAIGSDAAGVIPKEMDLELVQTKGGSGGDTLFQASAEYWDKQTSKLVLGQTMTSDDGASLAQSKTHERVRFDIRKADARAVVATINRDLIRPFVILNYGEQDRYPTIKLATEEPEDVKALLEATRVFVNLGGKVQMTELRDRLGFAEPDADAELLQPESVVDANASPPAVAQPPAPPQAGPTPDKTPGSGALSPPGTAEQNRRGAFAQTLGVRDLVDDEADAALDDWRPMVNENVGRLLAAIQDADSYERARGLLDQLAQDEGEVIALDALTSLLARSTFKLRGVGDAQDGVES